MRSTSNAIFAASALALAFATPAAAQNQGSMNVGEATISIGGGTALLKLPDARSIIVGAQTGGLNVFQRNFEFNEDLEDEIGWNINGSISVPLTGGGGSPQVLTLGGFWARVQDSDTVNCVTNFAARRSCLISALVDDPTTTQFVGAGANLSSQSDRDVDFWGASLESKWYLTPDVMGVTRAPSRRYWALGADVRGINQNINATISSPAGTFATYNEDLDTTYYGAFAAYGGDVQPFLFKGLWDRWGLQSSFRVQGGIYYADTDYSGVLNNPRPGANATSALSLSSGDAALIGGITLETSKQIGDRTTLSLKSEYEYYSYAPQMIYNQADVFAAGPGAILGAGGQVGTVIADHHAFSARTSLRLTLGLGPRDLYKAPAYK